MMPVRDHGGDPHRATAVGASGFIGLLGAFVWWVPPEPPEPWSSILGWTVLAAVAVLSAATAYVVGGRGKTPAVAAATGAAATFLSLPVVFGTLFFTALLLDIVLDIWHMLSG
jgi:hypothetical protein